MLLSGVNFSQMCLYFFSVFGVPVAQTLVVGETVFESKVRVFLRSGHLKRYVNNIRVNINKSAMSTMSTMSTLYIYSVLAFHLKC